MKCFHFSNWEKKGEPQARSASAQSNIIDSTNHEPRRSGSESNSENVSDISANSTGMSPFLNFTQKPNNLQVFTFHDLKNATNNFSRSVMLGEGGFGSVYRGVIRTSEDLNMRTEIAVKQLSRKGLQGHKEWLTEVNVLGIVEHPNLVKLIGYCAEDDARGMQRLLVYEYMPNRSVEDHLSARSTIRLPWDRRLRIALDAARGLTYLHEQMDFQIIFRDFKTSNILLDDQWNAKLSDFGLARQGPTEGLTHVSTAVVGTIGYAAPEYMQTGRLTAKSDIWSYGVVLYELITGRRPIDRNRPKGEQKLLEWIKPCMTNPSKLNKIIDPRIESDCSLSSVASLAAVANRCLIRQPKARPKMSEVLEMVQTIVETTGTGAPATPVQIPRVDDRTAKEWKEKGSNVQRCNVGMPPQRIRDSKMGEGRRFVWHGWTPKLVRTK